jgi:hypothetical protein
MDYTKKDCLCWVKNRGVDPVTKSKIEPGSYTYSRLVDLCEHYGVVYTGKIPKNYIEEPVYRTLSTAPKPAKLPKPPPLEPPKPEYETYEYNPECYTGRYKTVIYNGKVKKVKEKGYRSKTGLHTL